MKNRNKDNDFSTPDNIPNKSVNKRIDWENLFLGVFIRLIFYVFPVFILYKLINKILNHSDGISSFFTEMFLIALIAAVFFASLWIAGKWDDQIKPGHPFKYSPFVVMFYVFLFISTFFCYFNGKNPDNCEKLMLFYLIVVSEMFIGFILYKAGLIKDKDRITFWFILVPVALAVSCLIGIGYDSVPSRSAQLDYDDSPRR